VDSPRFIAQHRSNDGDRLDGPPEQVATGYQKVRASQHRELFGRERIHDGSDPRPVHLPRTHRAGFTTGVEDGTPDLIGREVPDCAGDKIGFRVRGRIAIGEDGMSLIISFTITHQPFEFTV
jgi:hypothetical protein